MASITSSSDPARTLTVLTVSGILTADEVIRALERFFESDVTRDLVWDFSGADLSAITRVGMERIIAVARAGARLRPDGRTALVVGEDLSFGLSRMYESLSEVRDHPIHHRVFRDKGEALAWLRPAPGDAT
jgi:hypothetical protein